MNKPESKGSTTDNVIQVGSRKSKLALIQTQTIINRLTEFYINNPNDLDETNSTLKFDVVTMTTVGDEILNKPLPAIGSKSLFTGELEIALLENKLDFVVHSLKDLPTTLPDGCTIGAILKRDDPEDIIILNKSLRDKTDPLGLLCSQPAQSGGVRIGTSSQRRIAMIKMVNPAIECIDIRGNLNTRLAKLDDDNGPYSAIILAKAGVDRMSWSNLREVKLCPDTNISLKNWCYAVGQGAIAVECRANDRKILNLISRIVDLKTTYEVIAERCMMKKLDGGCSVPLGTRCSWSTKGDSEMLSLTGIVLSVDGTKTVIASDLIEIEPSSSAHFDGTLNIHSFETGVSLVLPDSKNSEIERNAMNCSTLGLRVANKLIEDGCLELIKSSRIKHEGF